MFFELYLVDYNDDLIDVPVLIKNMQDRDGNRPNLDDSFEKESSWKLSRRFFLIDSKSGVEGQDNYVKGESSSVIRYAKEITLRIKLDPVNPEMIYPPLLIIEYRERRKAVMDTFSVAQVSFTSEY